MTNYTELERLAYISGQPDLAALYDKAAEFDGIDIDAIKEEAYARGHECGERAASDEALLRERDRLLKDLEQERVNFAELLGAFDNFLKWLGTDAAKTITNRRQGVKTIQTWLRKWR